MCKIVWSYKAGMQYEKQIRWYAKQGGISLASNFEQYISTCLNLVSRNPYMARKSEEIEELREYVVQKYPFIISYYIEKDNITITSFLHQSRNKEY